MSDFTRQFIDSLRSRIAQRLPYMQVVIGPRQVGKTTGVKSLLASLEGSSLFVTADEVTPPNAEWLQNIWHRAFDSGADILLALDEVQKIPHWSDVIKPLYDKIRSSHKPQIILLGSASLNLQQGLSESLAGRFELLPVYHWEPGETEKVFKLQLNDYLKFGGYPVGLELINDTPRWQSFVRNTIIEPAITRDILQFAEVSKPALFRQTFELAMRYPAQIISLQKILGQLQDSGNVTTIKRYFELLEGAFFLKVLEKYSGRPIVSKSSSPKILPLAPALVHAFTPPDRIDSDPEWRGRIIEMLVGGRLSSLGEPLWYWREGKHEVDFVLEINNKIVAIEVKSGAQKGLGGLREFTKRFPKSIPVVLYENMALNLCLQEGAEGVRDFVQKQI